ncbi:Isy1-like splicing factor [Dipodascopsis uninucleata]
MSRNSEKAQSMLYRFREQEAAEMGIIDIGRQRRPKAITEVDSIPECEKWRGQVVKEIGRKVTRIQDPALSDYQIRDLNDEINKLMREKYVWELQLRKLGGPNYIRMGTKMFDDEGREVPTTRGYKYFGRARELPGVKELLQPASQEKSDKIPAYDYKRDVDADYYGFRDEDNPGLLEYEKEVEKISSSAILNQEDDSLPEGWTSIEAPTLIPTRDEVTTWLHNRKKVVK